MMNAGIEIAAPFTIVSYPKRTAAVNGMQPRRIYQTLVFGLDFSFALATNKVKAPSHVAA